MSILKTNSIYTDVKAQQVLLSLFPSFCVEPIMPMTSLFRSEVGANQGPATTSTDWQVAFARWEPIVHLNGGTLAMRAAAHKYLPQEKGEESEFYIKRLARSVLYGMYSRTISSLKSLPFLSKTIVKDVNEKLEYLEYSCDGEGSTISEFAEQLLEDALNYGVCHYMVEMPVISEREDGAPRTLLDDEKQNIRPYFVRINPMNLISVKHKTLGSEKILTEVRVFEDVMVADPDNPWNEVPAQQVRVYKENEVQIWRKVETKGTESDKDNAGYELMEELTVVHNLGFIPLVTRYGSKTGFMTGKPVLEELAWLNLRHWAKLSDLDNIEHVANTPMAYFFGADASADDVGSEVVFGSHKLFTSGDPNAKMGYLEHSGQAIGASQKSIDMIEARAIAMGADLLASRGSSTRETFGAKNQDHIKSTSVLQDIVLGLESGLAQGYMFAMKLMALPIDYTMLPNVNIGDKMSLTVDANAITNLLSLFTMGSISKEDLGNELKRMSFISDSTEILDMKEEEPTQTPTQPNPVSDSQDN